MDYNNGQSLHSYLSSFSKNEPIYLNTVKKEIIRLFDIEMTTSSLELYFKGEGYTDIQLIDRNTYNTPEERIVKKTEDPVKRNPVYNDDDDDDDDFDPNAFIKKNKERIKQTAISSSTYKDNSWVIDKYQSDTNSEVLNELLVNNRGLVEKIASKYMNHTSSKLDYDDLVNEGFLGLMKAIERFDTTLGYQFSTYATWWIRQSITRAIMDKGYTIRVPVHMHDSISKMLKFERESILKFNEINVRWVAEQAEITEERYHELKKVDHMFLHLASLDIVVSQEDNDTSLLDFLQYDPHAGLGSESEMFFDPFEITAKEELKLLLEECLDGLREREREVLKQRFGWYGDEHKTLEEVGKVYGVTRERIRQLEAKALRNIRSTARQIELKEFLVNN